MIQTIKLFQVSTKLGQILKLYYTSIFTKSKCLQIGLVLKGEIQLPVKKISRDDGCIVYYFLLFLYINSIKIQY